MQIGAVKGVIGRAEFLLDHSAERRTHQEAPVVPAPLIEGGGLHAAGTEALGKPEPVQQPRRVRADVDAGADMPGE